MNAYQFMWDELGYGGHHAKVMATKASPQRKQAALNRAWRRKHALHYGIAGKPGRAMLIRALMV